MRALRILQCLVAGATLLGAGSASAWMDNDPDAYVVNFYTGGGSDGVLFAAGTANQQCMNLGAAQINVLSASPSVQINIRPGSFVVTGTDYGYLVCKGQRIPGTIVTGTGTGQVTLRVTYPPMGQWYDHTITLTGR